MSVEAESRDADPSAERLFTPNHVVIVGGNIAGATAAYCLIRQGVEHVVCIDPVNIGDGENRHPPCTGCGGLIQGRTVELLDQLGLTIPDEAIRRELTGYKVHLPKGGEIDVDTPMVSVFRGSGPIQGRNRGLGLDQAIHEQAEQAGVEFIQQEVIEIQLQGEDGKATVKTGDGEEIKTDFVVGAFGHNLKLAEKITNPAGNRPFDKPKVQRSAVNELFIGEGRVDEIFGDRAHVLIMPLKEAQDMNIWFAAFVPKGPNTVTMILMGRDDINPRNVENFMNSKYVRRLLPKDILKDNRWQSLISAGGCSQCQCFRNTITTESPANYLLPGPGGMVLVGDAGPTRLWKDGIGSAVDTASRAAQAIATGDFDSFRRYIDRQYPAEDHRAARAVMNLNDLMIRLPGMERLLTSNIPVITEGVNRAILYLLTGEGPYSRVPYIGESY